MRLRLLVSLLSAALVTAIWGSPAPAAAAKQVKVDARAWALIDARDGEVVASHAARRALPIASTTKLMTAYVALHELRLNRIVRASPYHPIYGESLLGLRRGQRISVRDLLYGLILRSGNDAAYDLARAAAGSKARFVHQMNLRAAALGLTHTHYANPIGLDQRGNYSSALDLTVLARRLLRIRVFAKIAAARRATLRSVHPRRHISTINELLRIAAWTNGVKTGHTFDAGYVLVGAGRRKGVELISAVIGAPTDEDRFEGTLRLLDFGFSQYRRRTVIHAGKDLADPSIRYAGGKLPLRAARSVRLGLRRGQRLSVSVRAPREIEGPIRKGTALGRASVLVDGLPAASVQLLAGRGIPKANAFDRVRSFIADHPIPLAAALFVILIGIALLWRLARRGTNREDQMVGSEERPDVNRQRREGGVPR